MGSAWWVVLGGQCLVGGVQWIVVDEVKELIH